MRSRTKGRSFERPYTRGGIQARRGVHWKAPARDAQPRGPWLLTLAALAGLLFLNLPFVVIMLYAFTTDEQTFTFPLPGLTMRWFALATTRPDLWAALGLSVQVALGATALALVLGTMAALAVANSRFFGREAVSFLVVLPLALPGIVTGIALRSTIGLMGIPFSVWTIVVGHATFCIVTVYNNVIARL